MNTIITRKRFLQTLVDILFPEYCVLCNHFGKLICKQCVWKLPHPAQYIPEILTSYAYKDPAVKSLIHHIKKHKRPDLVETLTQKLAEQLLESLSDHLTYFRIDTIVCIPIPQSKQQTRRRGFSQSDQIAQAVAKHLSNFKIDQKIKYNNSLLSKITETRKQASITNRIKRTRNIKNALAVSQNAKLEKTTLYILCDDIATTGATLIEANRVLERSGAIHTILCALAH